MQLSDYFLKKYVKDQYERMSMMPSTPKELEINENYYSKNTMYGTAWSNEVQEAKKKLEERLGISWHEENNMHNSEQYKKLQKEISDKESKMTNKKEPASWVMDYDERGYAVLLREQSIVNTEKQTQSKSKSMSIK